MKKIVVIIGGQNEALQEFVFGLLDKAGYETKGARKWLGKRAGAFHFTGEMSNCWADHSTKEQDDNCYSSEEYWGKKFDLRNEPITGLIEFLQKEPYMLGSYEVEFFKNGDVKVGCTAVTNDQMNEIMQLRLEAMLK